MKILHVHTLPVISGSGINTFLSMQGQKHAGHEVELACAPKGALRDLVEKEGMAFRGLKHMVWGINPIKDVLVTWELMRLIRDNAYDVVHTHNSKAGFVGRLAGYLCRKPIVIHTVHGFAFHDAEKLWKRMLYTYCERMAAHWCDHLIVISQPLIDWAIQKGISSDNRMTKIYSGIDVGAFRDTVSSKETYEELRLNENDFIIGEVAKLWEGKGHEDLLDAVSMLKNEIPHMKCVFVGEGNLREQLIARVEKLGITDQVIFTGFREDVPQVTQLLDVAILPSLFEGMGRAILEAQAAGKAVIGTRVGGIPDVIQEGETGLLVEPHQPKQLADAILKLYRDDALRKRLGQQAQQRVDEQFSASRMNAEILRVYEHFLSAKSRLSV